MLLASNKWSLGMLLNILQGMDSSPQQRIIQSKMSVVPRLKNPELKNAKKAVGSPDGRLIKLTWTTG